MKKTLLISSFCITLLSFLFTSNLYSVTASVKPIDAADQIKLALAKQKLYAGQYVLALSEFKEILQKNPNDATLLHYVGYCHYMLKENERAIEHLKKAKDSNKDVKNETYLVLGKIYLYEGKIDEAIAEFNIYKTKVSAKDAEAEDVDVYLAHCNNAKLLMASPVDVKIENLGATINSLQDDKNPCITADGRKLVFTSRRPETTDAIVDVEGDGKYFEDIYIASWDSTKNSFGNAELAPGNINTDAHDACTSISPDGNQIFIYKNDPNNNEARGGDIFVSKVVNEKWKTPVSIGKPINSSYWEGGACVSADGKTLFFTSERKGGQGNSDIWVVKKISKSEWGKPENLGPDVNTEYDEGGLFLAPDGNTLFFSSNSKASMGSYDIFKTTNENGRWSKPVNLGYPINSERSETGLSISANAKIAYISSDRKGGLGEKDVYKVDVSNNPLLTTTNGQMNSSISIVKGSIKDNTEGTALSGVEITVTDDKGTKIASTTSNEQGEYFLTIKGGVTYTFNVIKKGYKDVSEKIDVKIGKDKTYTLNKLFLLAK